MHKNVRRKVFLDEQRIWNITLTNPNKSLENKFAVRYNSKFYNYNKRTKKYLHKILKQLAN